MDLEFRFNKDDLETKSWAMKTFNLSENDFMEIRSFDGSAIIIAFLIAFETLVKNPTIVDKFLKREGCEVEFDEHGNLLRAKGYSASEVIKLKYKPIKNANDPEQKPGDKKWI